MTQERCMNTVELHHVWKRYQRGLTHHTLRDAIPALLTGWWRRDGASELKDNEFWALQDVSFAVEAGETLGIIGRNGAGKSTVLKLLSGISKPAKGTIATRGKLAALIEVGAGFHPDLTGRENVFLNGAIMGLKRREVRALFDQIVAFAEVEPFIDTPVKRYSSGMYVRLGFAIAAHVNPDVLLIDEVLSVGDLAFQQKCLQRIHELKQAGTTMIFISHNLNAVQRICDRAILLNLGAIVEEGDVEAVIRAYREQVVTREREKFVQLRARGRTDGVAASPVQITAVRLLDRSGRLAEAVEMGEPLTVEVAYACARRIEQPVVKIGIDRVDGMVCHVASTAYDGSAAPSLEGRGALRLHYPPLPLLPNAYRVSVEIGEEGRSVPLDARKHGAFFSVRSDRREGGAVHVEHRWQWGADGAGGAGRGAGVG